MSLHSAPCNLTRFPFSAYIGYSSRLWCAMHPFLAIPYAVAYAIIACMAISSRAALPYAHPYSIRYYSRRIPHRSAYAITLFGWVSYDCRVAFAVVDFRALCRVSAFAFQLSKSVLGEPNAYVNQCKQIRSLIAAPPFLLGFSHIQLFFTWSIQHKTPPLARCHIATNFGVWNNAQRVTRTRHAPTRRTPAHTSARQRANARANARTCTPVRPHTSAHTRHARTRMHTHARGPPADHIDANREPSALLRALQVQCNRRVCIRGAT